MTAPSVAAGAVSAAEEAEYVALYLGNKDIAPTDYVGCGCVPVFFEGEGEASPSGHFPAAEGVPRQADESRRHAPSPPGDPESR